MDSFELNKIIGAILGTLLFVMGVGFLAEEIYAPVTSNGPTYNLPEPAADASGAPAKAAPVVPLADLLAKADPQQGADSVKKCQSCHDFTEGGPNKTGPDLYNIVGSKIADVPGYTFSDAVEKLATEQHTWTYENLDKWLTSPAADAPGTKMTFVGIDDPVERANVLAYLRTLSKSPVPFPAPAAAAPAAAPAAGAAPAAAAPAAATPAPAATAPAATTPAPAATAAPAAAAPATTAASAAAAPAATAPTTTTAK